MAAGALTFDKFGEKERELYFESLAEGNTRENAARAAGVSRELIRQYRQRTDGFEDLEREAERRANGVIQSTLFQKAKAGNVVSMLVWLYNRDPEHWTDKRALAAPQTVDLTQLTDAELALLARLTAKAQKGGSGEPQQADTPEVRGDAT